MKTLKKLYESGTALKDAFGFMQTCNNCDSMIYSDDKKFLDTKANPLGYCKECREDHKNGKLDESLNKSNGTVVDGVYRKDGNYAWVRQSSDGSEWTVHLGYENGTNDAYGNETITGRKTYKTEKMAVTKAKSHTGIK